MEKKRNAFALNTLLLMALVFILFSIPAEAASFSKAAPEPKATIKVDKVTLRWKERSDLTGYKVYSCDGYGRNRTLLKKTSAKKVTIEKLKQGKTYYFCVRGYRKKGGKVKYTNYSKVVKVQIYRKCTLKQLLLTALEPVGSTMYVWGGGWNGVDSGAGIDARTIGVSKRWKSFFQQQNSSYNYRNTRFQIRDGLDCSGYIGWCIYNILETKNGRPGYVMLAQTMAQNFASRGWGTYTPANKVKDYRAGDIMSTSAGHVWMVVGQCNDGSVVILHSSPPGVQLMGTPSSSGKANSRAVSLAQNYMRKYFPEWYKKFPDCKRGSSYLTNYSRMRWDISGNVIMSDPEKYRNKSAGTILRDLFRSR